MSTENGRRLGWVGAGRMGHALARPAPGRRPRRRGLQPHAREGRVAGELGATVVDAPADLADRDIVFTMVAGSGRLQGGRARRRPACCRGHGAAPAVIVDSTTSRRTPPSEVRDEAERARRRAARRAGQRQPEGRRRRPADDRRLRPARGVRPGRARYLELLGAGVTYVGDGESARLVKICHNLMLGVVAQCMAEITVLAEKGGMSRAAFLEFLNDSVMGSMFTRYKTPAYVNLDFTPTFTPPLLLQGLRPRLRGRARARRADAGRRRRPADRPGADRLRPQRRGLRGAARASRRAAPGSSSCPRTCRSVDGLRGSVASSSTAAGSPTSRVERLERRRSASTSQHAGAARPRRGRASQDRSARATCRRVLHRRSPTSWDELFAQRRASSHPVARSVCRRSVRVQDADRVPATEASQRSAPGWRAGARRGGLPASCSTSSASERFDEPPEGGAALHEHARVEPARARTTRCGRTLRRHFSAGADRRARRASCALTYGPAASADQARSGSATARCSTSRVLGAGAMTGDDVRAPGHARHALAAHRAHASSTVLGEPSSSTLSRRSRRRSAGRWTSSPPRSASERVLVDLRPYAMNEWDQRSRGPTTFSGGACTSTSASPSWSSSATRSRTRWRQMPLAAHDGTSV